jgi:hypothetical protein
MIRKEQIQVAFIMCPANVFVSLDLAFLSIMFLITRLVHNVYLVTFI